MSYANYSQWNNQYNPQLEQPYLGYEPPDSRRASNDYTYRSDPSLASLYPSSSRNNAYLNGSDYQQQQYPTLPSSYDFQPSRIPSLNPGSLNTPDHGANGLQAPSGSPPSPQGQGNQSNSYFAMQPTAKRQRVQEPTDDTRDEEGDVDALPDHKEVAKGKPGACARCKSLKVRCEFRTDNDPCKRCLNGGHECVIPGRKKRRTPPKREHLLNQIQKQAEEIDKLMAKLAILEANKDSRRASIENLSEAASPPVLSPSSACFGLDVPSSPSTNKAVEDWFTKAKQSLAQFGGFLDMGGASMPKRLIVEKDLEDSSPEDSDPDEPSDFAEDNGIDIAVVDSDGEEVEDGKRRVLARRGSASSSGSHVKHRGLKRGGRMATLPNEAAPFGLMAGLSLRNTRRSEAGSDVDEEVAEGENGLGVANADFFRASPTPDLKSTSVNATPQAPYILARGIITPAEIEPLFKIFFDLINPSVSLVDPVIYTPERTVYRSPFLFTVICAISSRFYSERPEIYMQAMHFAQLAAGTALIGGPKNVEMCIAYILLSLYQLPFKRWEDSRGWLYLGLAIRIATDLNLHLPNTAKPQNEFHAREQLNRTRVWLNCFNLDRSTGSQYGKQPTIPNTDYSASHSEEWWKSSQWNIQNFDIHISCYNSELRVMAEFMKKIYSDPQHPTGLNKDVDFERLATETDEQLLRLEAHWQPILDSNVDPNDRQGCFRSGLLKLAFSYARLIALSYGFQHAFGKNNSNENPFLSRCLAAATDVVKAMVENIGRPEQRIYVRHGPEAQSVFTTFAAAFLVKLLQPKFASYLNDQTRQEIRSHVQSVIDFFSSPDIALDNRHGPKLYARFLKGLLASPMVTEHGVPRRRSHQPKSSVSSFTHSSNQFNNPIDHPSPATTSSHSLSPPPSHDALSFDQFAPASGGAIDPFQSSLGPRDDFGMNMSDTYTYQQGMTLPDGEDLLGMQSISDPAQWQDVSVPNYSWLSQFQNDVQTQMRSSRYPGYNAYGYGQNMHLQYTAMQQ